MDTNNRKNEERDTFVYIIYCNTMIILSEHTRPTYMFKNNIYGEKLASTGGSRTRSLKDCNVYSPQRKHLVDLSADSVSSNCSMRFALEISSWVVVLSRKEVVRSK